MKNLCFCNEAEIFLDTDPGVITKNHKNNL